MQTRGVHLCTSRLDHCPAPLTQFTDDELMMKETGKNIFLSRLCNLPQNDKQASRFASLFTTYRWNLQISYIYVSQSLN